VDKASDRDYWMIAEEAVEFGMVDEILRGSGKK
jgi:ATP-dependent Clp protease, protease subunit